MLFELLLVLPLIVFLLLLLLLSFCCGNALHIIILRSVQVYDLQIKAKTDNVASINVAEINFVGLTVDAGGDTKYPLLSPVSRYQQDLSVYA